MSSREPRARLPNPCRPSQHPAKLSFKTESYLGSTAQPEKGRQAAPALLAKAVPLLSLTGLAFPGSGFRLSLFPHRKGLFAEPSRAGLGLEPLLGLATFSRCSWTRLSALTKQKREQRKEINKKRRNQTNKQKERNYNGKKSAPLPQGGNRGPIFESSLLISTRWCWVRARPRVDGRAVPLAST